jgi:hypothetical protein
MAQPPTLVWSVDRDRVSVQRYETSEKVSILVPYNMRASEAIEAARDQLTPDELKAALEAWGLA